MKHSRAHSLTWLLFSAVVMEDRRVHYVRMDWGTVLGGIIGILALLALVVLAIFGVIYLSGVSSNTHDVYKILKDILAAIQAVAPCVCPIA